MYAYAYCLLLADWASDPQRDLKNQSHYLPAPVLPGTSMNFYREINNHIIKPLHKWVYLFLQLSSALLIHSDQRKPEHKRKEIAYNLQEQMGFIHRMQRINSLVLTRMAGHGGRLEFLQNGIKACFHCFITIFIT